MIVDFQDLFFQAAQFERRGKIGEAIAAYQDIANLATEHHERQYRAQALVFAGRSAVLTVTQSSDSYYRDALTLLSAGLKEAIACSNVLLQGIAYREMGVAADRAADFSNAVIFFQKSIESIATTNEHMAEQAATYGKLAYHLGILDEYDGAIQTFGRSRELFQQEPSAGYYQAQMHWDLAAVQWQHDTSHDALRAAEEALGWAEADHGDERYDYFLCKIYGLLAKFDATNQNQTYVKQYSRIIRTLDPLVARALESELRLTH